MPSSLAWWTSSTRAGSSFFRTAVDDRGLRAQPLGRAHGVHRHVAAAHDHDTLPDVDRGVVRLVVGVHQIGPRQELVGRNHAVEVLARDAHETGQPGARADEDGVEPFLVHQRVDRHGAAHDHVGLDPDTQPFDLGDFARHDPLLRETELGNAVDQHAARLVQRLENLHFVAHAGQVAGAGQPGRAAADDGDFMAVAGCGGLYRGAVFEFPVADEAFEFAHGDRLALDAQDARTFALALLRADAAADRGQRTVLGDDVGSLLQPAFVQRGDKVGDADAYGAGRHAAGILTTQAARGFERGLFEVVAVADLLEIGRTDRRVLFAHRHAGYLVCHNLFCPIRSYIRVRPRARPR